MSVAVLPAATGGSSSRDEINTRVKLDYWSALLPLVAQGVIAHQSAQRQQQLADACSSRRHPTLETTNAAQRATAQVLLHKGEFEASVRALAEITPDALVANYVSSVHDRVASLEAKVAQMDESAEKHDRWLGLVEEAIGRVENANKSAEEEQSRVTAQLTKSHKQLEGKVSQLSGSARAPSSVPPDPRITLSAHMGIEKRLASVEASVGGFTTKLEQQSTAVADAQRKARDLNAKVETLAGDLEASHREVKDTRAKVEPLLPLATKAESLLSNLDSSQRFSEELKHRNEAAKVRLDFVSELCKRARQDVEDLKNDEITPLKADIAGLLPLKGHVSALVKVPNTLDTVHNTITGLAPLKDHIDTLIPLAAESKSLMSLAPQQEQTARIVQQLESDVSSCMHDIPENRLGLEALEARVKGVEAWHSVIDQQKQVAQEQDRLKGVLERQDKTTRVYTEAQNRNARDLETVKAGLRKLEAANESNKEPISSIGPLCTQVGQVIVVSRSIRSELVEINNRIAQLEDGARGVKEKATSSMEEIHQEVKSMQGRISVFDRLGERVQALVTLSDRSESLVSLPDRFARLSNETRDSVRQNLVDFRAESAAVSRGCSQSHEKIRKLVDELQGKAAAEARRMEQLEARASQVQKESKSALESMEQTERSLKKSFEGLQNRVTTEKQRGQQLEARTSEMQRENSAALEARTKLQSATKTLSRSMEAAEAQLKSLEPLKDHIGALVSVADKHTQLVFLAQNLKQAQACFGQADNLFLACHATKVKVESLQTSVDHLNKRQDPTKIVEALTAEVGTLRPLVDRVAKVEEQAALFPEQYAPLEAVDKVQDRVSKSESEYKVLQGKLAGMAKTSRADVFELRTKAEDALRVANETAQSVDQLLPLKSHVAAITDLSGQSEQILALGKQGETTEAGMAKLFAAHEKGTRRYGELSDSVGMLRQTIEGLERKTTDMETEVGTFGQDLKDAKAAWVTKIRAVEAEIGRLSHSEQPNNALIGLVTPSGSPMSPTQRAPSTPDSRITSLERSAESAKRELKNIAQNLTRIDNKMNHFKEQLAHASGRLADLSSPVQTDGGAFSPLLEHVPALVGLASQEAALRRMPEHAKSLAGIVHQVNGIDSDLKDLSSRVPAAEQFKLMTGLLADAPSLKELLPLCSQVKTILLFASQLEAFSPLAAQVKSLMTLVQRAERVEPLALQMDKLLPLPSRVTELQTSVTELQTSLTKSGVRSQPNTSGQLSTSAEQDLPPITFLPQASSPPAPLFPSPDIDASLRPSKKRKLEEAVESIEERLDTMQNEVDNVVWDVAEIEKRVCPSKRARTSKPLSSPESGEITESESSRAQYDHPDLDAWRKKIDGDVDKVVKAVSQLWQGEGDWPERLESGLEVAWAKSLKLRENGDKSTGLAIVRLLNATRKDVDLVKLAVQSQGPGVMASGAGSVDAVMERIVDQMVDRMSKHHEKFKTDLEEWLDKSTKPVKDVCRALKTAGGVFE